MRKRAGLSLGQAAAKLDVTRSSLHRLESGETTPNVHIARSMMDLYDHYVPDLLDTIRASRRRGWWQDFRVSDREYLAWEAGAETLRELAVLRIPDLLQTEDYARELSASQEQHADEIEVLRIRQDRLTATEHALEYVAVLDESTLRNRVGSPRVMRDQLAYVVECAARSNVHICVLPASTGASVRAAGFRMLEFDLPDDPLVLYADCAHTTMREERREPVADAGRLFDAIAAAALSEEDSVAFIRHMARELDTSEETTPERKSA